jgi:hypothetical protein
LVQLHGRTVIGRWKEMAQCGEWDALVQDLLERHYDPAYTRYRPYCRPGRAQKVEIVLPPRKVCGRRAHFEAPLVQAVH